MATAVEILGRTAVSASQIALKGVQPDLRVDGIWGVRTDAAYRKSSDFLRDMIDFGLSKAGLSVNALRESIPVARAVTVQKAETPNYLANLSEVASYLASKGVTGPSLVNLLTTIRAETGFRARRESHLYRDPARAREKFSALRGWPDDRVRDLVASGPEKFFEVVYGKDSRKGKELGNVIEGDGFRYRGSGHLSITGRALFAQLERETGIPALSDPDLLVRDQKAALDSAVWYWNRFVVSQNKERDIVAATKVVNAGLTAKDISERISFSRMFSVYA